MELLAAYVLGLLTGAGAMVCTVIYIGSKAVKKQKADDSAQKAKSSITDRMKRVKEITEEQLDLAGRAEVPQKNALDGKYKNGLIRRAKDLDEEKMAILKSLLADGHDLELTTMDSAGVVTKMKLSEYLAHLGIKMDSKPKVENVGKFTVIRGGRDDDGNTNH